MLNWRRVRRLVQRVIVRLGLVRWRPANATGRRAERLAGDYLRSIGYVLLETNAKTSVGEADIVAMAPDGETAVVVEVKSRVKVVHQPQRSTTAQPEESITKRKQDTLRAVLRHLARANNWNRARIDVIAIDLHPDDSDGGTAVIRHYVNALS